MPALDDVTFDVSGLTYGEERGGRREWWTPAGDAVVLYHFSIPPDLGADPSNLEALWQFLRVRRKTVGGIQISLDTIDIHPCRAVRQIVKVPQEPSGMTYLGSVTMPFRDFSFVLKIECHEYGTTGLRETTVLEEMLQAGRLPLVAEEGLLHGWTVDPYDGMLRDGPYPNLSEAESYDPRFPEHPLSRVRLLMSRLSTSLQLSPGIVALPPFRYPPPSPERPWWRLW